MPRVTDAQVKEIIDVAASTDLSPFIDAADGLVDRTVALGTPSLSAAELVSVTLFLSAHFLSVYEKEANLTELTTDAITSKYAGKYGSGLQSSQYGQTALALDTTGLLSQVGSTRQASLRNIATAP